MMEKLAVLIFRVKMKTLKMEPLLSSETLIPIYKVTRYHVPEVCGHSTLPVPARNYWMFTAYQC
jgi:hypothetical protein